MAVIAVAVVASQRWPARRARTDAGQPAPAGSTSLAAAGRPTLWVLTIGVSRYSESDLSLRFAAADARAVADAFARQRGGPLYHEVQTAVLVDAEVTRASILRALDDFMGKAAPVDVGVIYMAGHGVRDELLDAYYFLPATASGTRPRIEGLDMEDFSRQLRALHRNLRRLVVILDTCHAGAAAGADMRRVGEDLAARLAPAEGLYILAAAKSGEQSQELATLGHGAFTQALLDGLGGGAADADGLIRVLGLAGYAARVVPELTARAQTPYLSIVGEDLVLVAHPERLARVTPPPLPTPLALAATAPTRERIAIMHFDNLRPDPQHDWMQEALGEQFSTMLHQVSRFDVYDERMVRFLARGATDPIEASRRADMAKLVDGTYWVHNNAISITAHVKNTNPLRSIASAQIDGPLERFSELSSQIVVGLLDQLRVEMSAEEIAQLRKRNTTDLAARKLLFDGERSGPQTDRQLPTPAEPVEPRASLGLRLLERLSLIATCHAAEAADPDADLRATLEGYRQAFERKDVEALRHYYSGFTPEQAAALQRYFDNADHLQVGFDDIRIAIIGDRAAVSFSREDHFVDHQSGESQQVVVRVTKLFAKGPVGWQIVPEE